ncbi:glucan biosynthesis protein G [Marinomonas algarum]|uniref:Glucan biosynthesis protein G n=1 Tax=Marinomonas algarum TaxID=2883105 RepID=A0A9X1IJY1_9GAMM|nr:glucan biosynthesis protein G [Marinomonas algarum]MCB5160713.1 glucan biosynthesis protein G [Marinomonas algarum]
MKLFTYLSHRGTRLIKRGGACFTLLCVIMASVVQAQEPSNKTVKEASSGYVFSHQTVIDLAKTKAQSPMEPVGKAPQALVDMDYSTYRKINFQQNQAVWGNAPTQFSMQLFAPGFLFKDLVSIDIVENGRAVPLSVSPDSFNTPTPEISDLIAKVGKYAGLRLHYPINTDEVQDEFVVFQGASYFRAVSKGQSYGLSARGLAVDVAQPKGEEFPMFTQFWIERPASSQDAIVVHALLDSKSVTGAYRFGIYPGKPTRMEVKATLFPRVDLQHVGVAPLTSMFMHNSTTDVSDVPDYRPAVHDSDGLQMLTGKGEMLWRPLNNPENLEISAFSDDSPKGFGLIQRHRRFGDYQDLEANYHTRPSAWIKPLNDWGEGNVELVEIPSTSEANDNIVAYWQPKGGFKKGESYTYQYLMTWSNDTPVSLDYPRIVRSALGHKLFTTTPEVVIDVNKLPYAKIEALTVEASMSNGQILEAWVDKNPHTNGVRVYVTFDPEEADASELRVQLKQDEKAIAPTWLYRWIRE